MKARSILFSAPMIRALLDGRKVQTRRVVKPQPLFTSCQQPYTPALAAIADAAFRQFVPEGCPYGQPGDLLWVVTMKPIPGLEKTHAAGDDGHIYRIRDGIPRRLAQHDSSGYKRVQITSEGKERMATAHELVCSAFYGKKTSPRHEVRHLDGNRSNNSPQNLDWGTPEQNWQDRKAHGRGVREQHHNAKLDMGKAAVIRSSGKTPWALAKEYDVSPKTVRNVLTGRTWVKCEPPSANMPRWASRLTLELTEVRVERLLDISEEDAIAEGIEPVFTKTGEQCGWLNYEHSGDGVGYFTNPVDSYASLWRTINGPGSWDANPFVWCLSFCTHKKNVDALLAERGAHG